MTQFLIPFLVASAFAEERHKQGFCFDEHLPGYYAVIRQSSSDRSKIDKKKSPLIISTDGLSGVKGGLYIGTEGVYLNKKEAENVLTVIRKSSPDAYVKYLGNYSSVPEAMPDPSCHNCWVSSQGGKMLRGKFVQKKGWVLEQDGAADFLVENKGEPAENNLCVTLAGTAGWLVSEAVSNDECCTKHVFRIVSFSGKKMDEKVITVDDGPAYKTVVITESSSGPRIVLSSNGIVDSEWSIRESKFLKIR